MKIMDPVLKHKNPRYPYRIQYVPRGTPAASAVEIRMYTLFVPGFPGEDQWSSIFSGYRI